jgi:heme oxygenase (biliverdin-IX-beta and delta-forming)
MLLPGNTAPSAIAELRNTTWPFHQRLEKRIDFKARLESIGAYRAHIAKMWGFYVALEPQLTSSEFRQCLEDCDVRRKVPWLERDLLALGADATAIARLPRCQLLPPCDEPAAAFGCAYVLEGATLGGRSLMPAVEKRLGLTAEHGAAFLASYGTAVEQRWRTFGDALNRYCRPDPRRARAAQAASATFAALEQWLCGSPA